MLKTEKIFQSKTDFSDIPKIRIFPTNRNTYAFLRQISDIVSTIIMKQGLKQSGTVY